MRSEASGPYLCPYERDSRELSLPFPRARAQQELSIELLQIFVTCLQELPESGLSPDAKSADALLLSFPAFRTEK